MTLHPRGKLFPTVFSEEKETVSLGRKKPSETAIFYLFLRRDRLVELPTACLPDCFWFRLMTPVIFFLRQNFARPRFSKVLSLFTLRGTSTSPLQERRRTAYVWFIQKRQKLVVDEWSYCPSVSFPNSIIFSVDKRFSDSVGPSQVWGYSADVQASVEELSVGLPKVGTRWLRQSRYASQPCEWSAFWVEC